MSADGSSPADAGALGRRLRFTALFLGLLLVLTAAFLGLEDAFSRFYLHPLSAAAAVALDGLGVPTRLDSGQLASGYCLLHMERTVFRVIPECTGIFSLMILLAAMGAYPAPAGSRALGAAVATVSFFGYGVLRLVLLGVLGHALPGLLDVVHLWMLSLVNLAFTGILWTTWIGTVVERP